MHILAEVPAGAIACRPIPCVRCLRQTSLVLVDEQEQFGEERPQAKCLSCRFRDALRCQGVRRLHGVAATLRFPSGPTFVTSGVRAEHERDLIRPNLRTMVRRHADGDFGGIGQFEPSLASEEARDLGALASRVARNSIAILEQAGDVLSIHESKSERLYCLWTILGRDRATLVFKLEEAIDVF